MRKLYNNKYLKMGVVVAFTSLLLFSCKKDSDGTPETKPGAMQFSSIDPGEAAGGAVLTLQGNGLGDIRSIVFDKNDVPASFTTTLNTEKAIVFRVPDTAFGGDQNIVLTNSAGKTLSVPFKVIALPTISTISPVDFEPGTSVTVTGNNLDDVSKVIIDGTSDEATVVSKSRKELVITMPSTTVNRAKLKITNSSGDRVSETEMTYMPNAFKVFTEGFVDGMQDWSWCQTHDISSSVAYMGTKSLRGVFASGSWGALSLHKDDPKLDMDSYTYLTFWAKGGAADNQFEVFCENGGSHKTITVPANVWTYYKLKLKDFMSGVQLERLDLQIHGPSGSAETIYFDNIMFVK